MSPGRREVLFRSPEVFSKVVGIHKFSVDIHGIPVCFHLSNHGLVEKLKDYFPETWQKESKDPFRIYWKDPGNFVSGSLEQWDDIEDPDCQFFNEWVFQRDFIAQRLPNKVIHLIAKEDLSDGIFNFLRYFLPFELLHQNKILFHSSCVVDTNDEAYLYFGPSGAGKSTISKLCSFGNILGDDMNLLSVHPNVVFVESAVVGQRYFSKENFGTKYVLDRAFWLKKAKSIKVEAIQKERLTILLSSFSGLFWNQLGERDYLKVFQLANALNKNLDLYNLEFNLDKKVWKYVREFSKNL